MARLHPISVLVCLIASGVPMVAAAHGIDSVRTSPRDIAKMKIFDGPLVALGEEPSPAEAEALAAAVAAFKKGGGGEAFEPFEAYLRANSKSPYRPSLQVHLGDLYRHYGYFTKALAAWQEAWSFSKDLQTQEGRGVGDRALAGLMELSSRLGRMDLLKELEGAAKTRKVSGTAGQRIQVALEGLWMMEHQPEKGFLCGPAALSAIRAAKGLDPEPEILQKATSTVQGTSLWQNLQWAQSMNMGLQAAKREPGAPMLVPSLVHWRAGHYAAVVLEQNGRYLLQDPTFGNEVWVSKKALDEESTGYALVNAGDLPKGWFTIGDRDASLVWGKGTTGTYDGHGCKKGGSALTCPRTKPCAAPGGPGGGPGGSPGGSLGASPAGMGMAVFAGDVPSISLYIVDQPIGYNPPVGPSMGFSLGYFQREVNHPQTFTFTNFGPKWSFSWQAYLKDDPTMVGQTVSLMWGLAGVYNYTGFNSTTQSYAPQYFRHDVLVKTGPSSYELQRNDGSKEIYGASDGAITFPRRIFLTKLVDPAGNAVTLNYDATMRLTSLTDALGQVSTLGYTLPDDPLKVTRITDPFGRHANFSYDAAGQLIESADVLGIKSQFSYGPTEQTPSAPVDFINALTTPYGVTTFSTGGSGTTRWLESVDALGGKERWEFRHAAPGIPASDSTLPTGVYNSYLNLRNTFYWDQRATAAFPGDYTMAAITQFTHASTSNSALLSVVPAQQKFALETPVWNFYPGQQNTIYQGVDSLPIRVARRLEDGTEQNTYAQYNALGKLVSSTDALGRKTTYIYDTNAIDLLEVRNTTTGNELLAKYTYNSQHKPLTALDAAGQITTFTYNGRGQVQTITNPKNETTTLIYDDNGYLTQVQGAVPGATTGFTYDTAGRLTSVTPADGAMTTFEYDAFDRRTRVNYADGTYEETVYNLLDVSRVRDRAGKWTTMTHNALRQLEEVQDAEGRITRLGWCGCGTLESLTDPNGRITLWARDLQGRVISKVYDDLTQTNYAYDTASRLKQRTDAKGQVTNYTYFMDNNLKQVSYTNAQKPTPTVSYTYDGVYNRLATMADGTGTTTFAYNPVGTTPALGAGRLASVTSPMANSTITYGYDELGRVTTRGINGVTETRTFDVLGRLATVSNPLGAFTYSYEGITGRLSNVAYPNGQNTQFTYFDSLGQNRLKAIKNLKGDGSNISTFGYEYDTNGQIQAWSQQADAQTPKVYSFQYDAVGQLLNATLHDGSVEGQILKTYIYGYDQGGNRTTEQIDDQVTSATFNGLNQLTGQRSSEMVAPLRGPESKVRGNTASTLGRSKAGNKAAKPAKAPAKPVKAVPSPSLAN